VATTVAEVIIGGNMLCALVCRQKRGGAGKRASVNLQGWDDSTVKGRSTKQKTPPVKKLHKHFFHMFPSGLENDTVGDAHITDTLPINERKKGCITMSHARTLQKERSRTAIFVNMFHDVFKHLGGMEQCVSVCVCMCVCVCVCARNKIAST
jgi:hypothetical protein